MVPNNFIKFKIILISYPADVIPIPCLLSAVVAQMGSSRCACEFVPHFFKKKKRKKKKRAKKNDICNIALHICPFVDALLNSHWMTSMTGFMVYSIIILSSYCGSLPCFMKCYSTVTYKVVGVTIMHRIQDVTELLGMMVEDHKRLQPNVKTYA